MSQYIGPPARADMVIRPRRGDLMCTVADGRWWTFTDPGWVAVAGAQATLERLHALMQEWSAGADPIRAAVAEEIRERLGAGADGIDRWVSP